MSASDISTGTLTGLVELSSVGVLNTILDYAHSVRTTQGHKLQRCFSSFAKKQRKLSQPSPTRDIHCTALSYGVFRHATLTNLKGKFYVQIAFEIKAQCF